MGGGSVRNEESADWEVGWEGGELMVEGVS